MIETLRDPKNRPFFAVGVAILLLLLVVTLCVFVYQFVKFPRAATPQQVVAPTFFPTITLEPTQTAPVIASVTPVVPVPEKVVIVPTASIIQATAGQSCYYSSAGLNDVLTPASSGDWSPIEHYFCDNGYWVIGTRDVVERKTGDWGQDGVPEKILIKYDSAGNIVDRIFMDPSGQQFPGPKQ